MSQSMTISALKPYFTFPFQGPGWKKRFLIGSALVFATVAVPVIPLIFVCGYAVQVMRRAIEGQDLTLPNWEDWGKLGVDGLKWSAVYLAFLLPGFIAYFGGMMFYMLSAFVIPLLMESGRWGQGTEMRMVALLFVGMAVVFVSMFLGMVLTFVGAVPLPAAMAHFVARDQLGAAFRIREWWKVLWRNKLGYFITWIIVSGLMAAAYLIIMSLYFTVVLCLFLPLIYAPVIFYLLLAWTVAALSETSAWGKWLAGAILSLALVAALLGLKSFYPARARRDDYASIAAVLKAYRRPQDAVLLYVDRDWPIFVAHSPGPRHDVPYGDSLDATRADVLLSPLWETSTGLWLVQTPESLRTDPRQTVPHWLAAHAVFTETWVTGENSLTFYARTAARAEQGCTLSPDFNASAPPQQLANGILRDVTIPQSRYQTGDTVRVLLHWETLPQRPLTLTIEGPAQRSYPLPPRPCITAIPLTPDLPGGTYQLHLRASDGQETALGHFKLLRKAIRPAADASPTHQVDYRLGESIHLVGYDLPQTTVSPGETLLLRLWWRTDAPLDKRYKVFTHLIGETYNARSGNFLWGQQDNEPENGQAPTTLWAPDNLIADEYHIPLAEDAPPGVYAIEVGMYGLVDTARLPVFASDGSPAGDAILLTTFTVQQP